MRRGAEVEEAIMLKRIALLVAMAALTIVKPSNAVAQGWDGCCGITVNVGFPFQHRDFCCERRFFPRRVDCCEERRFFPRRVFEERRDFCCEERFPRRVFFDEERRDFCCEERFPRRVFFDEERRDFCCEERRFFPRRVFEERRDFDAAPRPPAGIPGGYYNAGYVQ
jgi:hypothetical protein